MIQKQCGRCGRWIPSGSRCPCSKDAERIRHRDYDSTKRDKKRKAFYDSKEWVAVRSAALAIDDNLDVFMFMTQGVLLRADTVHHIIPLKDDWNRRMDLSNLMSLNHDTHSMIEAAYKKDKAGMQVQLAEMLADYREGRHTRGGTKKV